ncbi:MAG: hypothetical protein HY583_02845 [Candidatus Omnitrophica bacterium]|nr:hypothetical protein [Candidatus Omnitrophota bacterium]
MKFTYYLGRTLQVFALILMPSSIWVGHFGHNEQGAIVIFVASIALFFIGWLIQRFLD